MDARTIIDEQVASVRELEIRQLVEAYPETMAVFDQHGMDMCCGGAHTVAEAAQLHGLDADTVVTQVTYAIHSKRS